MSAESQLLRLTVAAYEAAVEPAAWATFLAGYAQLIEADITLLQRHDFSEHRSELLETFGLTQRFSESYNRHYSRLNIWREGGRHLYEAGRIVLDPEMCSRAALKRSEFYNDFLLRGVGTHSMAGVIARQDDAAFVLTSLREDRKAGWDEIDRPTVRVLLPHLARCLETRQRLQILEAGELALNTLNVGVMLLADDGRFVFWNRAAEQIIAHANDGLSLRSGRLSASDRGADLALRRLLASVLAPGASLQSAPDVLVTRFSGRMPYKVTASPLLRTIRPFIGMRKPVALVLVTDPEVRRPIAADALKLAYGLTPKEAALAIALAEGLTLEQAAERMAVRYETARTHLRRVQSKTQTSRQVDLVKLLERLSH